LLGTDPAVWSIVVGNNFPVNGPNVEAIVGNYAEAVRGMPNIWKSRLEQ